MKFLKNIPELIATLLVKWWILWVAGTVLSYTSIILFFKTLDSSDSTRKNCLWGSLLVFMCYALLTEWVKVWRISYHNHAICYSLAYQRLIDTTKFVRFWLSMIHNFSNVASSNFVSLKKQIGPQTAWSL